MIDDEDYTSLSNLSSDGIEVVRFIRTLASNCRSSHTDGFTQCYCKHQLYLLKCFIEDMYKDLPEFPTQEKEWEQERLIQLLKRTDQ